MTGEQNIDPVELEKWKKEMDKHFRFNRLVALACMTAIIAVMPTLAYQIVIALPATTIAMRIIQLEPYMMRWKEIEGQMKEKPAGADAQE